jgi:YolD-like protein
VDELRERKVRKVRVNDRGSIKWTAMMLPEHAELLTKMWEKLEQKNMPLLDEQKLVEMDAQLQLAICNNLTVEVKHYNGRDYLTSKGKLKYITKDMLYLDTDIKIKRQHVLDVWID